MLTLFTAAAAGSAAVGCVLSGGVQQLWQDRLFCQAFCVTVLLLQVQQLICCCPPDSLPGTGRQEQT